MKIINTVQYCF